MKQISRQHKLFALAGVMMLGAVLLTLPTYAQEPTQTENTTPLTSANLCDRIETVTSGINSRVSERRDTLRTNYTNRLTNLAATVTNIEDRLGVARQQVATSFEERITTLKNIEGLSDEQLAAIDTFQTDMIAADEVRQTTVDSARTDYRAALREIVSDRQDALAEAAATYSTALDAALKKAESNCSSASALTTLRADINAARNTFNEARQSTEVKEQLAELMQERNTAIKDANDAFRETAKQLSATLQSALGVESSDQS